MRNRTELVTTTLPGSENEEEASDLEDSEEDWKPSEKKVITLCDYSCEKEFFCMVPAKMYFIVGGQKGAAPAGKVAKTSPKTPAKRKTASSSATKGKGKPAAKKAKKEESEDDDEDFDEEEDEEEMDDEEDDDDDGGDSKDDKKKVLLCTVPQLSRELTISFTEKRNFVAFKGRSQGQRRNGQQQEFPG